MRLDNRADGEHGYEYSSQDRVLTLPNPLKYHNAFLVACAALILISGVLLLLNVRSALGSTPFAFGVLVVSIAMMAAGIRYLYACLSHLQFFFGRGRPQGLT